MTVQTEGLREAGFLLCRFVPQPIDLLGTHRRRERHTAFPAPYPSHPSKQLNALGLENYILALGGRIRCDEMHAVGGDIDQTHASVGRNRREMR